MAQQVCSILHVYVHVYFNDYGIKQGSYHVGACHSRNHFSKGVDLSFRKKCNLFLDFWSRNLYAILRNEWLFWRMLILSWKYRIYISVLVKLGRSFKFDANYNLSNIWHALICIAGLVLSFRNYLWLGWGYIVLHSKLHFLEQALGGGGQAIAKNKSGNT